MEFFMKHYIADLKKYLDEISVQEVKTIANVIYEGYLKDKQIFIMGNGGSASTSSHFACDLSKSTAIVNKRRLRVHSLNDNISLMTALSNDIGYDKVFEEQLINHINSHDVVIGISASGNSKNILDAMDYSKQRGAITIGFIGFEGGSLYNKVDYKVLIRSMDYGIVESIHLALEHLICLSVKDMIEKND